MVSHNDVQILVEATAYLRDTSNKHEIQNDTRNDVRNCFEQSTGFNSLFQSSVN